MNNQIPQTNSRSQLAQNSKPYTDPQSLQVNRPRKWPIFIAIASTVTLGGVGFYWLYWASQAFPQIEDGIKFLTEGSIALALLLVAVVQSFVYWSQRDFMKRQWTAMVDALDETRKLVAQNERAVQAAEKNAQIAEMADAPYFGIIGISLFDFVDGGYPDVNLIFFNGGKTPAWHFSPMACFVVGHHPSHGKVYNLKLETLDIQNTFVGSTGSHGFYFRQNELALTQDILDCNDADSRLFLVTTVEYRGRGSKATERQNFVMIWYQGKFCDWIAP